MSKSARVMAILTFAILACAVIAAAYATAQAQSGSEEDGKSRKREPQARRGYLTVEPNVPGDPSTEDETGRRSKPDETTEKTGDGRPATPPGTMTRGTRRQ